MPLKTRDWGVSLQVLSGGGGGAFSRIIFENTGLTNKDLGLH